MSSDAVVGRLRIIIVVETVLLVTLLVAFLRSRESTRPSVEYYEAYNPLLLALEYESPLARFEEIAKENPDWITFRQEYAYPDETEVPSVLSKCAILGYTNHVRVLLENGADQDEAVAWNRRYGSEDAALLVQQVNDEVRRGRRDQLGNPEKAEGSPLDNR